MPYSILIVDDSTAMRRSIRSCIEQSADWQICGEAEDGKIAIEKVLELRPDVALIDLQMPIMNGLEAARQIALLAPNTAMVMFTMHSCEQLVIDAHAAGITTVLSKLDPIGEHFLTSLRNACRPPNPLTGVAI